MLRVRLIWLVVFVVFVVLGMLLLFLALMFGAELGPKADPTTTTYVPRPDWYFYFLFYLLRVFKWPDSVILGTVGIPTIALILLFALGLVEPLEVLGHRLPAPRLRLARAPLVRELRQPRVPGSHVDLEPAHPPRVEPPVADRSAAGEIAHEQLGDEIAGQHEEEVEADEAALEAGDLGVEAHHPDRRDRQRAGARPCLRCATWKSPTATR